MRREGQSLIELIVATAVFVTSVTAVVLVLVDATVSSRHTSERVKALALAREGLEAARAMRDQHFDNLIPGTYGLRVWNGRWILRGASDVQDQFVRSVAIVRPDRDTAELATTILWQLTPGRASEVTLASRLTRWNGRAAGNWASPIQEASINVSGSQNGLRVAVQGNYAYVVRDGGSPDFLIIDIANPASPQIVSSLNLSGNPRDVEIAGNYVYVASTDDNELQIIDVSAPSVPFLAASYNAPGGADANAVEVFGTSAYVVRTSSANDELIILDITTPSSPVFAGSLNLGTTAKDIIVMNGYAYVATADDSRELIVIDVLNPSLPLIAGWFNSPGGANGETIAGFGSIVFLTTFGTGNLHVVDVSNPAAPFVVGFYDTSDTIRDIALGNNNQYIFLATDVNSAELQIVDISSPASPVPVGSFNVAGSNDLNGVAYHVGNDRIVAVGDSDTEEFIVIRPQ